MNRPDPAWLDDDTLTIAVAAVRETLEYHAAQLAADARCKRPRAARGATTDQTRPDTAVTATTPPRGVYGD